MSAGEYGAGLGPAGLDPLPDARNPPSGRPPVALLFDGRTRDFPLDSEGRYKSVGVGAQKAELALLLVFGKTPVASTQGLDLSGVIPVDGDKLSADVDSRVRAALAAPIAARDIEVLEILGSSPVRGAIRVYVKIKDLTDPLKPVVTITVG